MTNDTASQMILTIALARAGNIKVQTSLIRGENDRAREYLTGYIEQAIEDSAPQDITAGNPCERAAAILDGMHGPMLHTNIAQVVKAVIPD